MLANPTWRLSLFIQNKQEGINGTKKRKRRGTRKRKKKIGEKEKEKEKER